MASKLPADPSPPARSPCQGRTASGAACRAPAQSGRPFCFQHDPDAAQRRAEARRAGGRARGDQLRKPRARPERAPSWVGLDGPAEIRAGFSWAAAALVEHRIDPKAANALVGILGGAARLVGLPPPEPAAIDRAMTEAFLAGVTEVFGVEGREKLLAAMAAKHGLRA